MAVNLHTSITRVTIVDSVAKIVLVSIVLWSLVTGNCLSCPWLKPKPAESHHCCPSSQGQKEDQECTSAAYFAQGFAQPEAVKSSVAPEPAPAILPADEAVAFVADHATAPVPQYSPPDLYLNNSVLLI